MNLFRGQKVKGQGRKVTRRRCWPISRERNVLETLKLVERLSTTRAMMLTSFKVKRSRSRPINADTESVSYLWNGKACIRTTKVKVHLKKFLKTDKQKAREKLSELQYLLLYFRPGKQEKIANKYWLIAKVGCPCHKQ